MIQIDIGKAEEIEESIYVGMYLGFTELVSICMCIYQGRDIQSSYICGCAVAIISFTVPKDCE